MSYDLYFWKYKKGIYLDHQNVCEKCSNEHIIEGLESLPLELILKDIIKEYVGWKTKGTNNVFENADGNSAFQVFTTKQFVSFHCYGMKGEDLNRIIDVMIKYDCPLYDPQVPQRYDGKKNKLKISMLYRYFSGLTGSNFISSLRKLNKK